MLTLWSILQQTLIQFVSLFGVFMIGGAILTLLSRWTNNAFRQFLFPDFGMYAFGSIGVPVHEFCHALFCKLFFHEVGKVKWFDPAAKGGAHGSVTHYYNPWNLYHRIGHFFIGLGPAILGPLILGILFYALVPAGRGVFQWTDGNWYALVPLIKALVKALVHPATVTSPLFYLFLYLALCISSQIELSNEDIKQAAQGIVPLLIVLLLANILAWAIGFGWHARVMKIGTLTMMTGAGVFIFASMLSALNLALCTALFGVINRLSGRPGINPFRANS